ncbi:MAG: type 4a pilus biogenesis protein PilO [Deferribacteres bacterium]|nr:type 4a pilus biogenesis protein PilO [Deferribacteres bacterium]
MEINININKFKNLPPHLRIIITALPSVILIGLFVFFIYMPRNEEIERLNTKIVKLDKEIISAEAKIRKLDALREENRLLKRRLARLKEQLPEEKEVSELLKQISELGLKSGLKILLWKPGARKTQPAGLYVEIPVSVEVLAEYHKLGVFFSHISRLPRLVNISDMKLSSQTGSGQTERGIIKAEFTARTFASVEEAAGNTAVKKGTTNKK